MNPGPDRDRPGGPAAAAELSAQPHRHRPFFLLRTRSLAGPLTVTRGQPASPSLRLAPPAARAGPSAATVRVRSLAARRRDQIDSEEVSSSRPGVRLASLNFKLRLPLRVVHDMAESGTGSQHPVVHDRSN